MTPRLGRRMAAFNRSVTNRLTRPAATRLPGFGVVVHTGRRSGRRYRTPVNVFPAPDGVYVIALTYGPGADWVRNVMAAGRCDLETRGRVEQLGSPEIFRDQSQSLVPGLIRPILRFLRVADFMKLTPR